MQRQAEPNNPRAGNHAVSGFSLIELLVVVAVILIIAAIAIPNYIHSRMRANEASAIQSLRNISTAQALYSTMWSVGYADSLTKLSGNGVVVDQNNAALIDQVLAAGVKSGYVISLTPGAPDPQGNVATYSVKADPQVPGSSGDRHFYTDQSSVIRSNPSVPAGPGDAPIS
jgi:prepilin-type N-terminal cleavage/methylation domain-containing protein